VSKDYYSVLGLDEAAGQDQIKTAYRSLALKYHPDRNRNDPAATARMIELNEAYAVLSDPAKRKDYDLARQRYGTGAAEQYRQAHSQGDIYRGSDIDQVFAEFSRQFGFRNFDEVFRDAYGSDFQTFVIHGPGMSGRAFIYRAGGMRQEPAGQTSVVPNQGATPAGSKTLTEKLLRLLVKKTTGLELPDRGKDWKDKVLVSADMARYGGEIQYPYRKWGKTKDLMVRVPQNTRAGQSIRLKGMGGDGKAGGEAGDLYLRVRVKISFLDWIKTILGRALFWRKTGDKGQ
jgi:DnaJ-class molecular chaperone